MVAGKVKILRIIARLNIGGPAKHVVLLTANLSKDRYDSTLISGPVGDGEGDMSYLAKDSGIKHIFISQLSRNINPFADLMAFAKIFRIIAREKPDIVHTHTAKAGTIGRAAAILAGVPVRVHTFHGHVFYGYFNKLLTAYFLTIERVLARFTDRIIAISEGQKEELLNKYKIGTEARYGVVSLGLDLERFLNVEEKRGRLRRKFQFDKDDILIGIIGRLVPVKNHRMFIRVAKRLKEYIGPELFDKVRFVIIGDGPEKGSLAAYADSIGVAAKVFFCGWVRDIEEAYADLDIVALTSINEGTPLSLIEALASARPVIATDAGGVRDVVGNAGILTDRDDEVAFAKGLAGLIDQPSRRAEIGIRGRSGVMDRFSAKKLLAQTEKIYEELLLKKGISI